MKWLLISGGILVLLIIVVVVVGRLLPLKHSVTVSGRFQTGLDDLWKAIRDFNTYMEWRSSIRELNVIDELGWIEVDKRGHKITFGITEEHAGRKMVVKIMDKDLPFGGEWVYEVSEGNDAAALKITENGEIYNPVFRFVSWFFMDKTATLKRYMQDLQKHLTS